MIKEKEQTLIFGATRHHVEFINELCKTSGIGATCIYGAMDQRAREERLVIFRQKKVQFLIVTDLAARGIDIPLLVKNLQFILYRTMLFITISQPR